MMACSEFRESSLRRFGRDRERSLSGVGEGRLVVLLHTFGGEGWGDSGMEGEEE